MKNKSIFLIGSICMIALFTVILFSLANPAQAGRQPLTDNNPNSKLMNALQQELTKSDLSTEGRQDIEQRIGLLNDLATQQAKAYKNPAPRDPQKAPVELPQEDYYKIPDGIEANPIPPRQSDLVITNAWRKTIEDHLYSCTPVTLRLIPSKAR